MRFSSLLAYAAAAQCAVLNHVEFSTHSGSFDVDRSSDIENTAAETVANAFGKNKDGSDAIDAASSVNTEDDDNYIVIFKQSSSLKARDSLVKENFVERTRSFLQDLTSKSFVSTCKTPAGLAQSIEENIHGYINNTAIQGYYGKFSAAAVEAMRQSEHVAVVEKESFDRITENFVYLQGNAPWGLARISHQDYSVDPLTGMPPTEGDNENYVFLSSGGANTTIYVLDSGVNAEHNEFTGRVRWGANFVDDSETDGVGHGSHVAGIAAGYSVGVAKYANVVSVKVIDSNSRAPISRIIQGISWIIDDHNKNPGQRSIINYSAVGAISDARSYAVQQATDAGILLVTAAGNSAADACKYGPADMAPSNNGVITVGASNYTDTGASFSNYGSCVTVYAPGVSILSVTNDSTTGYKYMSGTSMASPFVAGLASYFWSQDDKQDYTSAQVRDLISNYNDGKLSDLPEGSPNKLAYNHL
ncbi:hypothetical protein DV451_003486 [Geotrichum candidum]|uniref:Peptidase S8/S53 domain-containing protein n=1 Tax=Geotrichum candidum TaxID=1173061 RepID=A0A9P5G3U8_GEOCN|nr:hypothetical protein DV451_003486 [Geotrichum candidum]KAF5105827.1 hypothetical protein DV453_004475 [Geotrichum candidum]